jgi:CubicO group peptidase (beta-lactamase class C family)
MQKLNFFPGFIHVITVAIWYLFSSGSDGKSTKSNLHNNAGIFIRNFAISTSYDGRDIHRTNSSSANFTPLENIEAVKADSFFNYLATKNKFNGSALVAHDGKIIYAHSFGFADFKTQTLFTDSSEFQLGSVSKQFTAASIMMLKERGSLDYDDFVIKYFPEFPYKTITIKMLLEHRSGLPNYMFLCDKYMNGGRLIDNMEVLNMLANNKPGCYFKPDRKFNYCNTNYCVLAAIVEKITGKRFAEFAEENIFQPLKMTHTHIFDRYDSVIPEKVTGYERNYRISRIDYLDGVTGDKGVYSTPSDLLKWDQALYSDKLLKQSTLKEAFSPHSKWFSNRSYGYGWRLRLLNNDTVIYHGGWWHGFNCNFIRDVKKRNTIIVLSNHINWCINHAGDLIILYRRMIDGNMVSSDNGGMPASE